MDISKSIQNYIEELSSGNPTPGGGNVAAFCGVLASSLGQMVCNLTIGKKKYTDFENEAVQIKNKLEDFKKKFLSLAKQDNEAFEKVIEAFKLPKETDEQKSAYREAIQNATLGAASVPLEVISTCSKMLPLIERIALGGNQNSISDTGVATSLILAASQSAFLNVAINCAGLANQIAANEILKKSEILFNEIKDKSELIIFKIIKQLRTS